MDNVLKDHMKSAIAQCKQTEDTYMRHCDYMTLLSGGDIYTCHRDCPYNSYWKMCILDNLDGVVA